jgi:primary-amine oxidase
MTHPLDPLTPDEITVAVAAVRATGRLPDGAWFSTVTTDDARRPGVTARRARVVAVPGSHAALVEATVDLVTGEVVAWVDHDGVRPALGFGESLITILALRDHAGFQKALAARGITDVGTVQVDPWPAGNFGNAAEEGRRVARCLPYLRA